MFKKLKKVFVHAPIHKKDGLETEDIQTVSQTETLKAFQHVSQELGKHNLGNKAVEILVSGGTCSVLYLKNRDRTKDIDFYIPDVDLIEKISDTQLTLPRDLRQRWPDNWINAEMAGFAMMPGCEDLYKNSIANNVVLYESDSLRVYAADWKFQLIGKITRAYQMYLLRSTVQGMDRDGKDVKDAVSILEVLIKDNHGPLDKNVVRSWYNGSALEDFEFDFINEAFYTKYNYDAFI